jgi:hypothetical protein
MNVPLLGFDPRKGMFRRYEIPFQFLCTMSPIFGDQILIGLVMEAHRRLRQLDFFLDEAWIHVHRSIAIKPSFERLRKELSLSEACEMEMDMACDAAEAFYVFGFRVLDITRLVTKRACGKEFLCSRPLNFMKVRNHLIIHPEKNPGRVLSWSAYITNEDNRGVVLKNRRSPAENQGHSDPGLGPNSIELQRFLVEWLAALAVQLNPGLPDLGKAAKEVP